MTTDQDSDLSTPSLPLMTWTPDLTVTNLENIYGWVERVATDAIAWYMKEKEQKARWSRRLRAVALILATLGGAVPVVALAAHRSDLGNWGYPLLALSAGAVAYDRFFGYSSAWQRYLLTATKLRGDLADFQLEWAKQIAEIGVQEPDGQAIQQLIGMARAFAKKVNDSVRAETEAWLNEFNSRIAEFDHHFANRRPNSE